MNKATLQMVLEPVVDGDVAPCPPPVVVLHPVRGILLFGGGVLVLACMDTTTKYLAATYDVPLIVGVRYVVNLLLMVAILAPTQRARLLQTKRTGLVIVRGACLALASIFMGFAFQRMPVAESTSIVFLAPSIVLLLARPALGERIGALGWLAAVAGFGGVVLVAHPGSGLEPLGIACAGGAALVTAVYQLLSRVLASTERTMALLFYTALVGAIAFGLAAPWFWDGRVPHPIDLLLFLSLGVYSGVGHYLFTAAHRFAPASTLAPIGYVQVVWAGLLGWLVFGHVPAVLSIVGMVIIIASGALTALKPPLQRKDH
ncbi:DMT family transporter [Sphingomonas sp.]|uniref:DMT family transporter n=1 Tax=Sphingomonas sp. TaxID=28214 RepID=UPI0038A2B589